MSRSISQVCVRNLGSIVSLQKTVRECFGSQHILSHPMSSL